MARPSTWRLFAVFASVLIIVVYFLSSHELSDSTRMGSSGVIHIVHFQFKAGTSESEKQHVRCLNPNVLNISPSPIFFYANAHGLRQVAQEMLALKDRCLHPETGKPYIKSFTGGKDNSPEGLGVS